MPEIPPLTVRVCDSLACALAGADRLIAELSTPRSAGGAGRARTLRRPLRPSAGRRGRASFRCIKPTRTRRSRRHRARRHPSAHPRLHRLRSLLADGGYKLLAATALRRAARPTSCSRRSMTAGCAASGGAGFPAGRKWRVVRSEAGPRLMAVNADEGEPGTFKDRHFLETDPHRFLEGMLIGAHVVEAAEVYIYLRDEYPVARAILGARDRRSCRRGRSRRASPARRRRVYLRRGIGDAREPRGQARAAAAQAALSIPGRAVRPADAHQQRRDALLGPRHRRARRRLVDARRAATAARACALLPSRGESRIPA